MTVSRIRGALRCWLLLLCGVAGLAQGQPWGGRAHPGNPGPPPCQDWREQFRAMPPDQRREWREQWRNERFRPDPREEFRGRRPQGEPFRDGGYSREDAARSLPRLSRHLDQIDANRDGVVNADELRAFREQRARERI